MLLISSAAFYNVAQSYVVLWQTKEIYGKKPEQGKFDFRSSLQLKKAREEPGE